MSLLERLISHLSHGSFAIALIEHISSKKSSFFMTGPFVDVT
jgi:hypothetical protein